MAVKSYDIDDIGTVHVYKRKGARSLRLSIASDGKIRVTVPSWATFASGLQFAHSRAQWIQKNLPEKNGLLTHNLRVGKAHKLLFVSEGNTIVRSRLAGSEIRILIPENRSIYDSEVQQVAAKACIRALRMQAEKLLPVRLKDLAQKYGFIYESVSVKQLKGRWGSCDARKRITLNLFLMQLPWYLIDYVLIHELTHTKHLNHGVDFWNEFLRHESRAKLYKKEIKSYKPILITTEVIPAMS